MQDLSSKLNQLNPLNFTKRELLILLLSPAVVLTVTQLKSPKLQNLLSKLNPLNWFSSTETTPVTTPSAVVTKAPKKAANYFTEKDENKLFKLIEDYAFAIAIMTNDDGTIQLTHAPFILDREKRELTGHFAKKNPMFDLISKKRPITLVFAGPHSYISPQWYVDNLKKVPTWNYVYTHIHGTAELISEDEMIKGMDDLSNKYEADSPNGWYMKNADQEGLRYKYQRIFGVRVKIERVEGNFKLGVDAEADKVGVLAGLRARNEDYDLSLADYMEQSWKQ